MKEYAKRESNIENRGHKKPYAWQDKKEVIKAFLDGKVVQARGDKSEPFKDVCSRAPLKVFDYEGVEWRIKPEPTYKYFNVTEDIIEEAHESQSNLKLMFSDGELVYVEMIKPKFKD